MLHSSGNSPHGLLFNRKLQAGPSVTRNMLFVLPGKLAQDMQRVMVAGGSQDGFPATCSLHPYERQLAQDSRSLLLLLPMFDFTFITCQSTGCQPQYKIPGCALFPAGSILDRLSPHPRHSEQPGIFTLHRAPLALPYTPARQFYCSATMRSTYSATDKDNTNSCWVEFILREQGVAYDMFDDCPCDSKGDDAGHKLYD